MAQFTDRKSITDWLDAHAGRRVRLSSPGTTLRIVGRTEGIAELDACSTDVFTGELRTGLADVQISITLHDHVLALHLLVAGPKGTPSPVSLPISVPYERVRLEPADAPEPAAREEPEFSPYELLHTPRPD
jgi:hypothetical protein